MAKEYPAGSAGAFWAKRNERIRAGTFYGDVKVGGVSGPAFKMMPEQFGIANRAKRPFAPTKPEMVMTIDYYDDITPTCEIMKRVYDEGFMAAAESGAQVIADSIAAIYDEGGVPEWKPVTPNWLYYKAMHGFDTRTMHQTNMLWGNVHELEMKLDVVYNPTISDFTVSGLDTAFAGTDYVWIHETVGVGRAHTTRPFIYQGLNLGMDALRSTGELINSTLKTVINEQATIGGGGIVPPGVIPPEKIATAAGEDLLRARRPMVIRLAGRGVTPVMVQSKYSVYHSRFHTYLLSLMWWFFPPSKMLAYYGMTMDLLSVLSGKLLEDRYMSLWLQAYIRGVAAARLGLVGSEKAARRKFRGTIYGRR